MHWIQSHILEQLLFADTLRNRDMRPPKVESNLYQYHLKQLIKDHWVEKDYKNYTLAPRGLAWADRYSSELKVARQQAKVISVLIVQNSRDEFLLIKRARQPFIGTLIIPSGKIKLAESITIAAQRELQEKTGLKNVALHMKSTARIITKSDIGVITDAVAFVWSGRITKEQEGQVIQDVYWVPLSTVSKKQIFPGSSELLHAFNKGEQHQEIVINI